MQDLRDNGLILENNRIKDGTKLYDMLVECPDIAAEALPGQIVHVLCGEGTMLRRPLSICETVGTSVRLCYEVRGKGTKWMSERKPGERISLLGAMGRGFTPRARAGKRALLVGGGIGIYPLLSIGKLYGDRAKALFGFRNISLINYIDMFEKYKIDASIITDDGSSGRQGFVTELLVEELNTGCADIVYVCGPKPMMAAVARICAVYGVECEVSMEERMGCGVGACLGCVCKTMFVDNAKADNTDSESSFKYKRVCLDGPVFNAKEIIWE